MERRHCVRQKVRGPAFASFDGVTGGMILDLSEEGMAMQTTAKLEANRRLQFLLELPGPSTSVETTGYIAWADALGRAGVRFSELPENARKRLNEWLRLHNDDPSRMAPKLTVAPAPWPGSERSAKLGRDRQAVSLEAEGEGLSPATVQYEFHSLGSDLNAALRLIGERARSLTRGSAAAIALAHQGAILCRASIGNNAPALGTRLDVNAGFSGECYRTGAALRCDDAETDPRVDLESCRRLGIRSILAAPIRYERRSIGLIVVFAAQPFMFDEGDVAVVESLAHTALMTVRQMDNLKYS